MQQLKKPNKIFFALALTLVTICSMGQQAIHPKSSTYEWPTEPDVKAKLENGRIKNLGLSCTGAYMLFPVSLNRGT
jgi:hypothetical protein